MIQNAVKMFDPIAMLNATRSIRIAYPDDQKLEFICKSVRSYIIAYNEPAENSAEYLGSFDLPLIPAPPALEQYLETIDTYTTLLRK